MSISGYRIIVSAITGGALQLAVPRIVEPKMWRVVVATIAFGGVTYVCERFWFRRL